MFVSNTYLFNGYWQSHSTAMEPHMERKIRCMKWVSYYDDIEFCGKKTDRQLNFRYIFSFFFFLTSDD